MPVSQPSAFPPPRGDDQVVAINAGLRQTGQRVFLAGEHAGDNSNSADFIVIGNNAANSNLDNCDGGVVIGAQAVQGTPLFSTPGAITALGWHAGQALTDNDVGGTVAVGYGALAQLAGDGINVLDFSCNTALGAFSLGDVDVTSADVARNVAIGYQAAKLASDVSLEATQNVVIGTGALANPGAFAGMIYQRNVVIGDSACEARRDGINNVIIGAEANDATDTCLRGDSNVLIGALAKLNGTDVSGCVVIGSEASPPEDDVPNILLIANNMAPLIYGYFDGGGILLGNFDGGADPPPIDGTNTLQLTNGTPYTGPPSGGGYFYCDGASDAALHWVQSDGTDTTLAGTGSGSSGTLPGYLSVALAAGTTDDWTPQNPINTVHRLDVDTTAGAATVTGLIPGDDGQMLALGNLGPNELILANQDAGSTATFRFLGPASLTLVANQTLLLVYNDNDGFWRMIG